jgi:hypothetical protein
MSRELRQGTLSAQLTIVQMLLKLHNYFPGDLEERYVTECRDDIIRLLNSGQWSTRNLCAKCVCVLYRYVFSRFLFQRLYVPPMKWFV